MRTFFLQAVLRVNIATHLNCSRLVSIFTDSMQRAQWKLSVPEFSVQQKKHENIKITFRTFIDFTRQKHCNLNIHRLI